MISTPSFAEAYIISDLHLGGEPGRQMFESGHEFKRFIDHVVAATRQAAAIDSPGRVLLAINGDFVDFLAEPAPLVFNVDTPETSLSRILEADDGFPEVLAGLQKFVTQKNAHLVVTLGNHDLELCLPTARERLLELLTNGVADRKGRVEFCFDGWGYRFHVGGKQALCLHGNEVDDFNFTRYDELDAIIHELMLFGGSNFARGWCPSAGSRFVIEAINPIKHRFPFIDLLKPEPVASALLTLLDPRMIVHADDAARLAIERRRNDAARPASQRRMLSASASTSGASVVLDAMTEQRIPTDEEELEASVEFSLQMNRIEERIHASAEAEMLGFSLIGALRSGTQAIRDASVDLYHTTVDKLKGAGREAHWRIVQRILRPLVSDNPHETGTADSYDQSVRDVVRRDVYDVVFAGHSHMRRLVQDPDRPVYVNTGTWAGLMSLSKSQLNSAEFPDIYDALCSPDRGRLHALNLIRRECTVARMRVEKGKTVVELGNFPDDLPAAMFIESTAVLPV